MPAFQFPDPAVQTTVKNPITGSTYQWQDPPGKWVVKVSIREVGDIVWEGDNQPDPIGDYKLWYSTDTLELYFYYCNANGVCAWLPTAANKNNQQDALINDLDARVDALAASSGKLEFKGRYTYVLEKTTEACTAAYAQCLLQAGGDVPAMSECNRLKDVCDAAISEPYAAGSFTSKGTTNIIADIEEFLITSVDADGQTIDWLNTAEEGDYLEFFDSADGDTALFEIVDEPATASTEQTIRVKFINQTGLGDGNFNLQQSYDIRVFKGAQGIDLIEADARYVAKPYVVYFEDSPADITPVHSSGDLRNGELWFDSSSLEMFVWVNNAWVATSPPPSQDIVVTALTSEVETLKAKPDITSSTTAPVNPKQGDLWFNPSTLKFAFYTSGAWINPDKS